jgi:hypothetical protein
MSRRVAVVVLLLLLGLLIAGIILMALQRARLNASLARSQNNLRELALFAHYHANPDQKIDVAALPKEIPPGTVFLPGVPPEERLGWPVNLMPVLDQKRQDVAGLLAQIDTTQPWIAEANQIAGRTPLVVLVCPGVAPKPDSHAPAITCYVGIAGLAPPDSATIALVRGVPTPPRAGAFRYDAPTPFDRVADGLSQTLLMGESAFEPGPWLRGGRSTLRGLDDSPGARPLVGAGGQFGGFFPTGGHFALCDGGVRLFTPRTTPHVLLRMATIADGKDEVPID